HESTEGCAIIKKMLDKGDPAFINGVEFSCADEYGKYQILGYGYDPESPQISEIIAKARAYNVNNVTNTLNYLRSEYGFVFSNADREALLSKNNPSKRNVAALMVKYGYATTKNDAIVNYIRKNKTKDDFIRPEEVIHAILKAKGIPVLSHPFYGHGDELFHADEVDKRIKRLVRMGLKGIEAFYSGFTKTLQEELLLFADKYNLYVTAGSDYHGSYKLDRIGDTDLESHPEYPKRLQKFLKKVHVYNGESVRKRFALFRK
ncbi:MAG: hypothetical protein J5781_04790, partial [Clostridia bacterium]|nr:hypothetical protein [Clostridia bacterium]